MIDIGLKGVYNNFFAPIINNLTFSIAPWIMPVVSTVTGLISDNNQSSGPSGLSLDKLRDMQAPTQNLIDEQLGLSRQMMDPHSAINQNMKKFMAQRAGEAGAQAGSTSMKMAAMKGVSAGQAMMSARQAQNQATGGVNRNWLEQLNQRFGQGVGLMGNMSQMQQGLNENLMNAYTANVSQQQQGGGAGDMLGGLMQGIGSMFGGM